MIGYLDSSALVKRYVHERGSREVDELVGAAEALGTLLVSRTEVVAALAKGARIGSISPDAAARARRRFEDEWDDLVRLALSETLAARAAELAWTHSLRGYDALHLAAAEAWAGLMRKPVVFASFDRALWRAGRHVGLRPWPEDLQRFLGPPAPP